MAGLCLAASVPPWGWWPLAFVGVVLLDRLLADRPAKARFRIGWLVSAAWLYPSIVWMADLTLPGYLVACLAYATYFGLAFAFCPPSHWRWLAMPGAFVMAEWLRWTFPFGGVPLSTLAMGQADAPLAPTVRVLGALELVALVAVVGVGLAALLDRRWIAAVASAAVVGGAWYGAQVAPRGKPIGEIAIAIVQGGGEQRTRAAETDERVVFERHLDASADVETPVDLVLWPENVVNVEGVLEDNPEGDELGALAEKLNATLIPGIVEGINSDEFLNASLVYEPNGEVTDRYDKVQRVPFGEYVPFRSIVSPLSGGSVDTYIAREAVAGNGPAVLDTPPGRVGISISWEIFFGHRARDAISNGGTILLNPTNGASYWLGIVQAQQVASSRLRALETDRWVLQAAPTGYSAIVTSDGNVVDRTAISERRVLQDTVELRSGQTIATRVGDWPMLILAVVTMIAAWLGDYRHSSRELVYE